MQKTLTALVFAAVCGTPTEALSDTLQQMDVFTLEWASDPQVAPNGNTIAYSRVGYDLMSDRTTASIWLVDDDGANHRPLTDIKGSLARWSPSGDRVAFVSRTDGGVQLHMHWLAANRTTPITQLTETPRNLAWSPDGQWLAFTMLVPKPQKPFVELPKAPEGANWAPQPKVIETMLYRADGTGYLKEGFAHLFVVPAEGGTPRQVTSGDFNHRSNFAWAPDSRAVYLSANRRDDWEYEPSDSEIYRVDIATGEMQALTERYGPDVDPALSPNGRYLAYRGYDEELLGYNVSRVHVLDLTNDTSRVLAEDLDRNVDSLQWRDNQSLYIGYTASGLGKVDIVTLSDTRKAIVEQLGGTSISRPYSGGDFHAAGGRLAYTHSVANRPANVAVVGRGGPNVLTALNRDALAHKDLATIEAIEFPSGLDGKMIQAWVAKPPGFDANKRYPLILEIHGGPFAAYGPHFSAEVQLYAAAGYVVVYANPRGSSSYGKSFGNLIHHAYPGGDYHDLMSAVDYAIDEGWADSSRLFVTGGSGGGILTAWIVTQTGRFRAAVAAKPVINWYSFVLTADQYNFFYRAWFPDLPWNVPDAYLARSPVHFVHRVTTPTMLLTGERDYRTPISESEQFYQALKLTKVDTAMVRVPDASHGIAARPSHLIAKVAHVLAWFERYDTVVDGD
ncbi:MAG: S9 family peptidase [Gammaproteobacteria bacterium]|nr:S9 family peptidase [Gammaproteobacteria bacterium]